MKNIAMRIIFAVLVATVMFITVVEATDEYPPIEIRFDGDEDAVALKSISTVKNAAYTQENGKIILTGPNSEGDIVNFNLADADKFDLYDYQYLKVKYKSNSSIKNSQLYIVGTDGGSGSSERFLTNFVHSADTADIWHSPVRTFGTDNKVSLKGLSGLPAPEGKNDNIVNQIRFDICREGASNTIVELEYIAFFHTEEEALAYGNTCNEYVNAVNSSTFIYDKAEFSNKAELVGKIQNQINGMENGLGLSYDMTATVSISDEIYNALMEKGSGCFDFTVTFSTYKSVDRIITKTAELYNNSAEGTVGASSSSESVESGGVEFTLTAHPENIKDVTAYKWYSSADDVADENDTLVATVTTSEATIKSSAQSGDTYYYVVLETLNGNYTSEAVKVTFVAPETIIWDMSIRNELDKWESAYNVKTDDDGKIPVVTDPNGVSYAHFAASNSTGDAVKYSITCENPVNIDNRPYMVERYRRSAESAVLNHYFKTPYLDENPDKQGAWFDGMLVSDPGGVYTGDGKWHTSVRNIPERLANQRSTLKGGSGYYEWRSSIRYAMLELKPITSDTYIDHEFIAFAATEEEAYKVGADYAAKLIAKKADMSAEFFKDGTAAEKLTAIINEAADIYGYNASEITMTYDADVSKYTYSFILLSNGYTYSYEESAHVIPEPVIWNFNNPDFASKWTTPIYCTSEFVDDAEVSYLYSVLTRPTDADCSTIIWNIPEENRFNATDYPYFAIRYKSSQGGNLQLYPATSLSTNSQADGGLYYQFAMSDISNEWQTLIKNVKTDNNKCKENAGTWDGTLKYIRFDLMRGGNVSKWIKIDYIAFFATRSQAEEYVASPYVFGDKSTVDEVVKDTDFSFLEQLDLTIVDEKTASEKLDAFIRKIDMPEGVDCTQAILGFDAGDQEQPDGKIGSYNAKLYFLNGPLGASSVAYKTISIPLAPNELIKPLGAQIRTSGATQGLRFGASLEKNIFGDPDITDISYGTVILPEDVMPEGEEITLDTIATDPRINIADVKGEKIYSETDSAIIYTAVITGISPENEKACERRFVTRPYVKYTFNDAEHIVYADAQKIRSVNDVKDLTIEGYETAIPLGKVSYERESWMVPFWKGNVVYHETFWPVMPDGADENADLEITLMYPVTEVLALKDGTNSVDFAEGKDFYIRNGKIIIPSTSGIRRTPFDYYISDNNDDGLHGQKIEYDPNYNGKYLFYKETTYIQENFQYSVSYLHSEEWPETALDPTNDFEEDTLTATRQKLENNQKLVVGFYGDSITAFGNNTGNYGTHPNTPKWSQMVVDSLRDIYDHGDITLVNKAVGGKNTNWGRNGDGNSHPDGFAKNQFANEIPDLFVLAFGMNDEDTGRENFKENLINIINQIRELNPNCEFLLVSNSLPNPIWKTTANRIHYEEVCEEIVTELRAEGVVIDCAKLQSMHKHLLTVKPYRDMTGNNVNHQNDMLARLYAQTVLSYITDLYK